MSWLDKYEEPTVDQLKHYGVPNWKQVTDHSELLGPQVHDELTRVVGDLADKKILDFGCGIGRISLMLHHMVQQPTHACDVNVFSIEYMKRQLPSVDIRHTDFQPPLPYEDDYFDAIFSISIWTHLHPKMQIPWLMEMRRVLKLGGYALISVAGIDSLPRRQKVLPDWERFTEEDVRQMGQLFLEYRGLSKFPEGFPGISDSYGSTIHDTDFILSTWGCLFDSIEYRKGGIANVQDLVVLRK